MGFSEKHSQPTRGKKARKQRSPSPPVSANPSTPSAAANLPAKSEDDNAPLPSGWFSAPDPTTGKTYYYTAGREVQWAPPVEVEASKADSEPAVGTRNEGTDARENMDET